MGVKNCEESMSILAVRSSVRPSKVYGVFALIAGALDVADFQ